MNRRRFVKTAVPAGLAAGPASAAHGVAIFELRYIWMRTGNQVERTTHFLSNYLAPAAHRLGIGPVGFFNAVIAPESPFVLILTSYPSLDAFDRGNQQMSEDQEFQKGFEEYNSMSELSYIRMENALLRGFEKVPAIVIPPAGAGRVSRVFELRTYESNNAKA